MENYNFERYVNIGSRLGNYKISINRTGMFGVLSGFYTKEGIKGFKKAILFFDSSAKAIGMSFTNDENAEGAFSITHNGAGNNSASIAAHSFFMKHNLKNEQFFGRRIPRKIKDSKFGSLFVVDLIENK